MVAPFENLRGDSTLAWLSGAWMDGLIASLGQIEQVWVVPRTTVASAMSLVPEAMAADMRRGPLADAAREAGATHLVIGSFHPASSPAPGTVHVTCQLQDLRDGRIIMSRQEDLDALESDLMPAIDAMAAAIGSHLGPCGASRARRHQVRKFPMTRARSARCSTSRKGSLHSSSTISPRRSAISSRPWRRTRRFSAPIFFSAASPPRPATACDS